MTTQEHTNGAPPSAAEPWGEPEPFDVFRTPPFPVDVLTPWHRDWVTSTAEFTQTPIDLAACVSLGVVSLAVSRLVRVEVRKGWVEPTNIWTVTALPPAERKSSVYADATRPVYEFCQREADRLAPLIVARASERRILEGQIKAAEAAAVKGEPYKSKIASADLGPNAALAACSLGARLQNMPELRAPKLTCDDVTAEALARVLSENDEHTGLFSAEGGPFEVLAGRYSTAPSIEMHLKAHAGDSHDVDRIGRPSIKLRAPLLVIAMTVQPSVIAGLASKPTFRDRGLLARILYSLPTSALGSRAVNAREVPRSVAEAYEAALAGLLGAYEGGEKPLLRFEAGADALRATYQQALEPRLGPDGDLVPYRDWAGKLTGAVCRLAGVLHMADLVRGPGSGVIPAPTLERAVRLGDYFLDHAIAAFGSMGADETSSLAKSVWEWTRRRAVVGFSARDAQRSVHGASAEETAAALAVLVGRNLIREVIAPVSLGIGRPPSRKFEINPRART